MSEIFLFISCQFSRVSGGDGTHVLPESSHICIVKGTLKDVTCLFLTAYFVTQNLIDTGGLQISLKQSDQLRGARLTVT